MAKKDIDTRSEYVQETENNQKVFQELVKRVRPDLYVLMDLLDETGVNILVLLKVMRHLNNIATGNKYGEVVIEIADGQCTFVRGVESDRVQAPVIDKKELKGNYQ